MGKSVYFSLLMDTVVYQCIILFLKLYYKHSHKKKQLDRIFTHNHGFSRVKWYDVLGLLRSAVNSVPVIERSLMEHERTP